jgi:hypothetical protein
MKLTDLTSDLIPAAAPVSTGFPIQTNVPSTDLPFFRKLGGVIKSGRQELRG